MQVLVVEGSIAKQEKKETDWKLKAMLEVITGSTSLPKSYKSPIEIANANLAFGAYSLKLFRFLA